MTGFGLELQRAVRTLRRSPGFTTVALLCLTLGIGANTALFSVVHPILLRPLPFPEAETLVAVWVRYASQGSTIDYLVAPQQLTEIEARVALFERLAAARTVGMSAGGSDEPQPITAARASADLFPLLGIVPILGRPYTHEEDRLDRQVALLAESFWRSRYGADTAIVGSTVILDEVPHVVLGVLPDAPVFPADADVWVPLAVGEITGPDRTAGSLAVIGRLVPGVTVDALNETLGQTARDIERDFPDRNNGLGLIARSLHNDAVRAVRPSLVSLTGAVLLVLAISIANVANLLLVRAQRDRRQVALRTALGASRHHILRQVMAENLILAIGAGGGGVVLAYAGLPALLALQVGDLFPYREVGINGAVLVFTAGTVLVTAALVSVGAAVKHMGTEAGAVLKETGGPLGGGRRAHHLQSGFVVAEIAIASVLLVGAGLLSKSFAHLQTVSPGFTADRVLTLRVTAPPGRTDDHALRVAFFDDVLHAVRAVLTVEHAGATHVLPISDILWGLGFNVEGRLPPTAGHRHLAVFRVVTPGYHESMRITLLRGRLFDETDRSDAPPVAVVSRALAREHWPGEDPIGKRVKRGTYDSDNPWMTVVGVVEDVRDSALAGPHQAALYLAQAQLDRSYTASMAVTARTTGDPSATATAIRAAIRGVAPDAVLADVIPLTDLLSTSIGRERFSVVVLNVFAALGIVLAMAGIYGVVSYRVGCRTGELALRLALGARVTQVLRLVLSAGVRLAAVGAVIGLLGALVLSRLLASLLHGVSPVDPSTYVGVAVIVVGITTVATWLPARRATRVDPAVSLRAD